MNNPSDKTVLIVNDSPDQRELMQIIFQQAGYRASTASDGREGFQVAKNTQLDLIISDVIMPDGDGIELCLWIRSDEKLRSLPILLVSGLRKDVDSVVEGLEVGADDYIELPVDPQHLIARAERLIERKRMEDVLRDSESYFRSLIENVSDIISILSVDGTILYQSPSVEQILGYQPDELIGKHAFDFVHTDDLEKVRSYFKTAAENSEMAASIEFRFKHHTDSWRILESIGKIIDAPSRGTVFLITSRDITKRREAEKALRKSENQLQTIFDNTAIGVALVNLQGFPIQSNKALQQMLGYADEELQQMSFPEFTHPEDVVKDMTLAEEIFEGKRDHYQIEKRYLKKSGEVIWVNLTVSAIPDDSGKPMFALGMIEDITKRKLAEQNISFQANLLDTVEQAVIATDLAGTIIYWNRFAHKLYGWSAEEAVGRNIIELTTPKIVHAQADEIMERLSAGKSWSGEFVVQNKDADTFTAQIINTPVNDGKGTLTGFVGISIDITERKQTERKLREREEWMRAILDGSRDGIVIENGSHIAYINKSYARLLGYDSSKRLVGKQISDLLPPDEAQRLVEYGKLRLRGENVPSIYEFKSKHKDGSLVEVEGSVSTSVIGGRKYIMTAIRDITERKLVESALEQSERDYRTVFEQAHDAIMVFTPEHETVLDVNRRACELYGFSRSEFIGMSIETISKIPANGKDKVKETLETGESHNFETIQYRKDGTEMFLEVNASTIIYKGREAIITINRDITERRQTEQGLRESEENFRALVLATTQYVWTFRENGDSEALSQWWMNLTGLTFEEVQGDGWLAAIHPEDRVIAGAFWQNAFANRILFDTSYRIQTKTGEYRHYAVRGVPVFNTDGSFRQWIGTFNDITEQKQAEESLLKSEEQLRQSQKLESVGRLAGGIAHDFNNMLTAINGYSELTLRKLEADSPLRRNIEEIKKAGERSAMLTHQLLAFSRQQVLQTVVLDLNEVITDTINMLERLIGADVRLETILDAKLGHVTGDPGQLTQVIMNLTVNARDAMPEGGNLIIETANVFLDEEYAARHVPTKSGLYVMLTVTDTGSGMDDETQKNIFEPFYTTKDVGKGTGLGMATVYGIVKQSGGFIWVESEIGVGSKFKIYLPCIDAEVKLRSREDVFEHTAKESATILIVEDEDLVRALTRQTLEECGYKVIEASSGSEALKICLQSNCAIDLVITDVVMPQMGGRELAEKLTEKLPNLQILFTSGYTDDAVVRLDIIGADTNFIQKPFTFEALINKVGQFLNKRTAEK